LTEDSKNLATVETRIQEKAAGATEKTDGKILEFAWHMKKRNLSEATIKMRVQRLNQLVGMGADLTNPDSVETVLATEEMSPAKKRFLVQSYKSFTNYFKIDWEAIKVRYERKMPFIPLESEIDQLIAGCSKKIATFLQVAKETGARAGEIKSIQWTDVNTKNNSVSINNPLKGSMSRTIEVSDKTIAMINAMPKKSNFIFNTRNIRSVQGSFAFQRKRLATTLQNPRLNQIHIHTFRHWFATMLYHKTRNFLYVKQQLGHKRSENTEIYTHLIDFKNDEYDTSRATTVEEAESLRQDGWEKYDEIDGVHLYCKRK
jgi:integrase